MTIASPSRDSRFQTNPPASTLSILLAQHPNTSYIGIVYAYNSSAKISQPIRIRSRAYHDYDIPEHPPSYNNIYICMQTRERERDKNDHHTFARRDDNLETHVEIS